jgi:D-alanine--D-alanine ligase
MKALTLPTLKSRARQIGMTGFSRMNKPELVEQLLDLGDWNPALDPLESLANCVQAAPQPPAASQAVDAPPEVREYLQHLLGLDLATLRAEAQALGVAKAARRLKRELVAEFMDRRFGEAATEVVRDHYVAQSEPSFLEADLEVPRDATQLADWKTDQLKAAARARGVAHVNRLRKSELIAALVDSDAAASDAGLGVGLDGDASSADGAAGGIGLGTADPLSGGDLFKMDAALDSWASQDFLSGRDVMGAPQQQKLRVALLCGGPTAERGISLNSARSVLDHLQSESIEFVVYYVDLRRRAFSVPTQQVYSNTPSDFDFKLSGDGIGDAGVGGGGDGMVLEELAADIQASGVQLVLPALHGALGEDGELQGLLESAGVPFVGTGAEAAAVAFDKGRAARAMAGLGVPTVPSVPLSQQSLLSGGAEADVQAFFSSCGLAPEDGAAVVKPARGGSSIGVSLAEGVAGAMETARGLAASAAHDGDVILERRVSGREFCVNVIETPNGPLALMPSEVELLPRRGAPDSGIYDYRRKYLPTLTARTHTPARFSEGILQHIRGTAERLFREMNLHDFARFDGWFVSEAEARALLPESPAPVLFSDMNLICGMEQTSFLFQQAANAGLTHQSLLLNVLNSACTRQGVSLPMIAPSLKPVMLPLPSNGGLTRAETYDPENDDDPNDRNLKVFILCGGNTSERHVSLMSGTNAFLQLRKFSDVTPHVFMLDCDGSGSEDQYFRAKDKNARDRAQLLDFGCKEEDLPDHLRRDAPVEALLLEDRLVYEVPYAELLHHTVEEVRDACRANELDHISEEEEEALFADESIAWADWTKRTPTLYWQDYGRVPLQQAVWNAVDESNMIGAKSAWVGQKLEGRNPFSLSTSLRRFVENARVCGAVVFNALHGGGGEDGRLQSILEKEGVCYTGSGPEASHACFDKNITALKLAALAAHGVKTLPKYELPYWDLVGLAESPELPVRTWEEVTAALGSPTLVMKPASDGCSAGVAKVTCSEDLRQFAVAAHDRVEVLEAGSLSAVESATTMPKWPSDFLLEPFVQTADIRVQRGEGGKEELVTDWASDWVEVTVGAVGQSGEMRSLTPSVTVKEIGDVLTLEEKFQGGTGVNLTPPPPSVLTPEILDGVQEKVELIAAELKLEGFSRVDAFVNTKTGDLQVIEVNTVPGLTPSTVLFHQALAEDPPIPPEMFFRAAVDEALQTHPPAPVHEYEAQYWVGREWHSTVKSSDRVPPGWVEWDTPDKPTVLDHPDLKKKVRVAQMKLI